jgi:hypothetical protein
MNLTNNAWIVCNWTLQWTDQHGNEQPRTNYPDSNDWLWTGNITLDKSSDLIPLHRFADHVPNSSLNFEDRVWMYVYVRAGNDRSSKDAPEVMLFDRDAGECANFGLDGGVPDPDFGFTGFQSYG